MVRLAAISLLAAGCHRQSPSPPPQLEVLGRRLESAVGAVEEHCRSLSARIRGVYGDLDRLAEAADADAYVLAENGTLFRPDAIASGRPAVFVSGVVPVTPDILRVVRATEAIDPDLERLVTDNEQVVQAYYNDHHSFNRIYPPFDVVVQYPPGMNIPEYNFYYLADDAHNPGREPVWVKEPYVDPAGRGWMISCVAPVHAGGRLEGVCGLDITIDRLVRDLDFDGRNPFYLLLAEDGTVVATGEAMIQVLRLPPLKNHRYVDTVRSDTFRSAQYNLHKSSSLAIREMAAEVLAPDASSALLDLDNRRWAIHVRRIRHLDWRLLAFMPRR
ncbi:hypothetical protein Hsar01_02037 [Haloferula sargassicola]|uniref:Cache domain-containing protein n=2 Tax=Haloferula sargassicola TaxID=490096 RepID=A0ABP9UMK2_9BACT